MAKQTLEMRYIDRKVLSDKLKALSGTDYEVEMGQIISCRLCIQQLSPAQDRKENYVLTLPRQLTNVNSSIAV